MAPGPILVFDKSALQSLNPDEAVWLDNFFMTNVTPLFFVETLADLEKAVRSGRTPKQVVGNLAYKTPDMQASANVHHLRLIEAELFGGKRITMDGRPVIAGGAPVVLDGRAGIVFKRAPEEEALHRWQRHEFLEIERQIARNWRRTLSDLDFDGARAFFQKWFSSARKPTNLAGAKSFAESQIDGRDQEGALKFCMILSGVAPEGREHVLARWRGLGRPAVKNSRHTSGS